MAKLIKFSRQYSDIFEIRDVSEIDGIRIRFHSKTGEKPLNYQIDVTLSNLINSSNCVTVDGYKLLNEEWECYSRLASLKKKPHKTHHIDYISSRKSVIKEGLIESLGLLDTYKTIL